MLAEGRVENASPKVFPIYLLQSVPSILPADLFAATNTSLPSSFNSQTNVPNGAASRIDCRQRPASRTAFSAFFRSERSTPIPNRIGLFPGIFTTAKLTKTGTLVPSLCRRSFSADGTGMPVMAMWSQVSVISSLASAGMSSSRISLPAASSMV